VQAARQTIRSLQTTALYVSKKWLRLSATNPPVRTSRVTDRGDRAPPLEQAPPADRAPRPGLVPPQAVVLAPPPPRLAGRFRRPTNCATDKQYWGRFSSSGSLAMLAAMRQASSGRARTMSRRGRLRPPFCFSAHRTEESFAGRASSWRLLGEAVQLQFRPGKTKNLAKRRSAKMLAFGWLVVLLGVLAIQWADGRLPFVASL
jgi:hypothetical protein